MHCAKPIRVESSTRIRVTMCRIVSLPPPSAASAESRLSCVGAVAAAAVDGCAAHGDRLASGPVQAEPQPDSQRNLTCASIRSAYAITSSSATARLCPASSKSSARRTSQPEDGGSVITPTTSAPSQIFTQRAAAGAACRAVMQGSWRCTHGEERRRSKHDARSTGPWSIVVVTGRGRGSCAHVSSPPGRFCTVVRSLGARPPRSPACATCLSWWDRSTPTRSPPAW
jgi:hypothetical protein